MAEIASSGPLQVSPDDASNGSRPHSPEGNVHDIPSSPQLPSVPDRPATPPSTTGITPATTPRTPRPHHISSTPQTPRTVPHPASVYLSSPIRRSRNHANLLASGAMTPGRPSLKYGGLGPPQSPFRASRTPGGTFGNGGSGNSSLGSSFSGGAGRVQFDSGESLPSMPLQTLLMTAEQATQVDGLDKARELLVLAIEQSERFRKAAQQFRTQANNLSFQHKLVQIERDESEQRHEVESSIQQREIQKLVTDIMGYSDKSIGTDQIRRKLKKTKTRLKEMEDLLASRDHEIAELQAQLVYHRQQQNQQPNQNHSHNQNLGHNLSQNQNLSHNLSQSQNLSHNLGQNQNLSQNQSQSQSQSHNQNQPQNHTQQLHQHPSASNYPSTAPDALHIPPASLTGARSIDEKPRPPPIDTQLASHSASSSSSQEPLSALEVLASQVLSSGIQRPRSETTMHAPTDYGSSPYQSSFYTPFSPFAVPPNVSRPKPSSLPQFGSPEKRRRPSSSSTISALSEDDTLEEVLE